MDLIYALCTLIKKLMCNDTSFDDITRVEAMIRMYLIRYDRIDLLLDEGPIPAWISQYNFLCLLNLPDTMRKYGSIRNLWEGGKDGESYLKTVKGHLKAGLVNEWQTWVITNLLKKTHLKNGKIKIKLFVKLTSETKFVSTATMQLQLQPLMQGNLYLFLHTTKRFIFVIVTTVR